MRRCWLTSKERDVPAFQAPCEIKNKRSSVRRDPKPLHDNLLCQAICVMNVSCLCQNTSLSFSRLLSEIINVLQMCLYSRHPRFKPRTVYLVYWRMILVFSPVFSWRKLRPSYQPTQCHAFVRWWVLRLVAPQRTFLVNLEVPDEGSAERLMLPCALYESGAKGDNRLKPNALLRLSL